MSRLLTAFVAPLTLLLAAAFAPSLVLAHAQPLKVDGAWARKAPGVDTAAVYFVLKNTSDKPVAVVGVRSSVAKNVMIHETSVVEGQSQMRMKDKVVIDAGKSVSFAPGGLHVMLTGLTKELAVGDTVQLFLSVEGGHPLTVSAVVKPLDAQ